MGAVYSARDLHFPNVMKRVAVKEMINMVRDPMVRETIIRNFEREANILATLDHPSIPRIYDYFTQNERSYLILEYIDGKDLEMVLREASGFLPEAQVVGWAIELCDVLSYLHNYKPESVIFRDMKPSNVMLTNYGHVMLVDFGIAKTFQTGQKGTMIGTEGYSPPEQYKGEASPLADIYALGATLHHLLTKRDPRLEPPFSFSERSIRSVNQSISFETEAIVNTALQYNPPERFPSAEAMKQALITSARKTGLLANIPSSPTGIRLESATIEPLWNFECEDEIRGSPTCQDGAVYIGSYDHNLYALQSLTGNFIWKYAAEGGIVCRPVVYEGNVYFGSEDHRLHVVSSRSGRVVWTYYTNAPIRSSPTIAEGHVFLGSDDGHLHAINAVSSRRAWQIDAGSPIRSSPILADDFIYFGTEGGEFYCVDLSGTVKWRFRTRKPITSTPVISKGVVYFGSIDSTVYALDVRSGFIIWRFRLSKATISSPFICENLLFTGSIDNHIYAIDIHSAKEIWRFETGHQVTGSPVIYKDSLYCGSVDGSMYCLEYRTGRLRWKYATKGPITGTPTICEDLLFFGSSDHFVYALVP